LKRELADSTYSLKLALDSNDSLNNQVKKLTVDVVAIEAETETWKIRCYDW